MQLLKTFSPKRAFLLVVGACAGLLVFAYILEFFVDLVPCPLCIVQRCFYLAIGVTALVAAFGWIRQLSVRLAGGIITALALLGGGIAMRQVWMQHFPQVTDPTRCGVSFGSFFDSVILALGGAGNCGIVDWTFLTLSIAEWSALCFLGFAVAGLWFVWRGSQEPSL
ncbi:MAG: hypothetical protein A2808_00015 [Candidatus Moranbacteria bacterium RIFCSPHIGHO2_01_FULL_55_24]|nr:MAG: hypothetical protein A2808_00015 [Candidatus Moranbacteria bacterium RIFCSPHIGHO2_01_FULL_55_24]